MRPQIATQLYNFAAGPESAFQGVIHESLEMSMSVDELVLSQQQVNDNQVVAATPPPLLRSQSPLIRLSQLDGAVDGDSDSRLVWSLFPIIEVKEICGFCEFVNREYNRVRVGWND